jgi:hypothetical protein
VQVMCDYCFFKSMTTTLKLVPEYNDIMYNIGFPCVEIDD